MNTTVVRMVERSGTKLIQEVGDTNPWRREWCCPRKSCLPCQGQAILEVEKSEAAIKMVCGTQES